MTICIYDKIFGCATYILEFFSWFWMPYNSILSILILFSSDSYELFGFNGGFDYNYWI